MDEQMVVAEPETHSLTKMRNDNTTIQEAVMWHMIGPLNARKSHLYCLVVLVFVTLITLLFLCLPLTQHTLSAPFTRTQQHITFNHAHTSWFAIQPTTLQTMHLVKIHKPPFCLFFSLLIHSSMLPILHLYQLLI